MSDVITKLGNEVLVLEAAIDANLTTIAVQDRTIRSQAAGLAEQEATIAEHKKESVYVALVKDKVLNEHLKHIAALRTKAQSLSNLLKSATYERTRLEKDVLQLARLVGEQEELEAVNTTLLKACKAAIAEAAKFQEEK